MVHTNRKVTRALCICGSRIGLERTVGAATATVHALT
jgi:hypothetical protein